MNSMVAIRQLERARVDGFYVTIEVDQQGYRVYRAGDGKLIAGGATLAEAVAKAWGRGWRP
jgi:hypothetical protein